MLTGCQIWHTIFMRKKNNEIGKNFLSGDSVKVGRSEKEVIWFPEKLRRVVLSQYRLIYIAKFEEGIYVFHLITKKTSQRTNKLDIELSKRRYREILKQRTENRSK